MHHIGNEDHLDPDRYLRYNCDECDGCGESVDDCACRVDLVQAIRDSKKHLADAMGREKCVILSVGQAMGYDARVEELLQKYQKALAMLMRIHRHGGIHSSILKDLDELLQEIA